MFVQHPEFYFHTPDLSGITFTLQKEFTLPQPYHEIREVELTWDEENNQFVLCAPLGEHQWVPRKPGVFKPDEICIGTTSTHEAFQHSPVHFYNMYCEKKGTKQSSHLHATFSHMTWGTMNVNSCRYVEHLGKMRQAPKRGVQWPKSTAVHKNNPNSIERHFELVSHLTDEQNKLGQELKQLHQKQEALHEEAKQNHNSPELEKSRSRIVQKQDECIKKWNAAKPSHRNLEDLSHDDHMGLIVSGQKFHVGIPPQHYTTIYQDHDPGFIEWIECQSDETFCRRVREAFSFVLNADTTVLSRASFNHDGTLTGFELRGRPHWKLKNTLSASPHHNIMSNKFNVTDYLKSWVSCAEKYKLDTMYIHWSIGSRSCALTDDTLFRYWTIFDKQSTLWWEKNKEDVYHEVEWKQLKKDLGPHIEELKDSPLVPDKLKNSFRGRLDSLFNPKRKPNDLDMILELYRSLKLATDPKPPTKDEASTWYWKQLNDLRNDFAHGDSLDNNSVEVTRLKRRFQDELVRFIATRLGLGNVSYISSLGEPRMSQDNTKPYELITQKPSSGPPESTREHEE